MSFDFTFHITELLTVLTAAYFVIRAANRVYNVLRDYPPHAHINGTIVYPEGFPPPVTQRLYPEKSNGASA